MKMCHHMPAHMRGRNRRSAQPCCDAITQCVEVAPVPFGVLSAQACLRMSSPVGSEATGGISPGSTELMRTPLVANSNARFLVSVSWAALATA